MPPDSWIARWWSLRQALDYNIYLVHHIVFRFLRSLLIEGWAIIWQITLDPGNKKMFSVPRTEPCVNEVFSIVICIYHRFDSQAPERVSLVYNPSMSLENLCGTLYDVHTCDLCDLLCLNEITTKLYGSVIFLRHTRIINDSVRVCMTLNRDLKLCVWRITLKLG